MQETKMGPEVSANLARVIHEILRLAPRAPAEVERVLTGALAELRAVVPPDEPPAELAAAPREAPPWRLLVGGGGSAAPLLKLRPASASPEVIDAILDEDTPLVPCRDLLAAKGAAFGAPTVVHVHDDGVVRHAGSLVVPDETPLPFLESSAWGRFRRLVQGQPERVCQALFDTLERVGLVDVYELERDVPSLWRAFAELLPHHLALLLPALGFALDKAEGRG